MSSKIEEPDDIRIEDLFSLLDKCIMSDKENVKKALRELLVIVALSTPADVKDGPLTKMLDKVKKMEKRLSTLESDKSRNTTGLTYDQLELMKRMIHDGKHSWTSTFGDSTTDPWKKLRGGYDTSF